MTNARRKPCFECSYEDPLSLDTDEGECSESRYYTGSCPDCLYLRHDTGDKIPGHSWENCTSGKLHPDYEMWRWLNEDSEPCNKCHGSGRVRRCRP